MIDGMHTPPLGERPDPVKLRTVCPGRRCAGDAPFCEAGDRRGTYACRRCPEGRSSADRPGGRSAVTHAALIHATVLIAQGRTSSRSLAADAPELPATPLPERFERPEPSAHAAISCSARVARTRRYRLATSRTGSSSCRLTTRQDGLPRGGGSGGGCRGDEGPSNQLRRSSAAPAGSGNSRLPWIELLNQELTSIRRPVRSHLALGWW